MNMPRYNVLFWANALCIFLISLAGCIPTASNNEEEKNKRKKKEKEKEENETKKDIAFVPPSSPMDGQINLYKAKLDNMDKEMENCKLTEGEKKRMEELKPVIEEEASLQTELHRLNDHIRAVQEKKQLLWQSTKDWEENQNETVIKDLKNLEEQNLEEQQKKCVENQKNLQLVKNNNRAMFDEKCKTHEKEIDALSLDNLHNKIGDLLVNPSPESSRQAAINILDQIIKPINNRLRLAGDIKNTGLLYINSAFNYRKEMEREEEIKIKINQKNTFQNNIDWHKKNKIKLEKLEIKEQSLIEKLQKTNQSIQQIKPKKQELEALLKQNSDYINLNYNGTRRSIQYNELEQKRMKSFETASLPIKIIDCNPPASTKKEEASNASIKTNDTKNEHIVDLINTKLPYVSYLIEMGKGQDILQVISYTFTAGKGAFLQATSYSPAPYACIVEGDENNECKFQCTVKWGENDSDMVYTSRLYYTFVVKNLKIEKVDKEIEFLSKEESKHPLWSL